MNTFLSALDAHPLLADGAMGSYLFELTGRLSEANHLYECFNVERPELVEQVHRAYLEAGAQCIVTNTFGANTARLGAFGLAGRVAALNRAGVDCARRAIAAHTAHHPSSGPHFVLGSIGPVPRVGSTAHASQAIYGAQIEALIEAGVDAIAIETLDALDALEELVALIVRVPGAPPLIAQMTIHASNVENASDMDAARFVARMAELGVPVAGVNCCAPWDALAFVEAVADTAEIRSGVVRLAVRPNGGGFQRIGNRFMSMVNPEYAGRMARTLIDRGVRLVGGCCEMHPPHLREMGNYLRSRLAHGAEVSVSPRAALAPTAAAEKRANGPLSRKLMDGEFVVSVELLPPRGTDPTVIGSKIEFVRELAASGLADALDLTDGSRGIPLMPPADFIHLLRARLGWSERSGDALELIPHFTGRDLNAMAVQGRLIGYHANRIRNVLFVTGDPPKMSPTYPGSTAVFDLDSLEMIRLSAQCLNAGVDFGGAPLGRQADPRTWFTIGTGFEPESQDPRRELERLRQKIEYGADYVMTQPAFRAEALAPLEGVRDRVAVLVGVMVLVSAEHARRVAQVPGVVLPESIHARMEAFPQLADQAKAGQEIAIAQIRALVAEGWNGIYLMSPASNRGVIEVLTAGLE